MHTALAIENFTSTAIAARSIPPTCVADVPAATAGLVRSHEKDEEIFAEGHRAAFVYKVVSGAVRTSRLLCDGRRQIDAFHLSGDIFGIEAGDEHRFTAESVGNTVVIAYRRCSIEALAASDSALAQQFVVGMMRSLERAQDHVLLLGRKNAIERIASFLLDLAERIPDKAVVDLPMSRIDIADHLGLTIETVSRTLSQLEREAVIGLPSTRRIVLRNKTALQRLAA